MVRDQARGFTGFEGNPLAKTPHLDQLAGQCVRFTRFYVPTPQSGPSRAALLTGQYPHMTGVTADGMALPDRADTVTERFKRAGYACGYVGQWGLSADSQAGPGFGLSDYVAASAAPGTPQDWLDTAVRVNGEEEKSGKYLDDWHADRAIDALERLGKRSLFLWVAFSGPGEPFVYPPGLEEAFPPASVKLPESRRERPQLPQKVMSGPAVRRAQQTSEQQLREARSKYLAMIARIDENIGRIVREVERLGLTENTLVVFVSDSGIALGDHQLLGKAAVFHDELVRVPMMMRWPGRTGGPDRVDDVVSMVDLYPTCCDWADIKPPFGIPGRSLAPLLSDPENARMADERFFEYHHDPVPAAAQPGARAQTPEQALAAVAAEPPPAAMPRPGAAQAVTPGAPAQAPVEIRVRGIVTSRYKLIDYLDDQDLLHDLERDPCENVMSDLLHYRQVQKVLYDRLRHWRLHTRDPWTPQP